jgi:UDP-glucose 4-epimerase
MGNFFRVPADNRDLNYEQYFVDGKITKPLISEFTSNNTIMLDVEQVKEKLLTLSYVQEKLKGHLTL